jgi:uncharacterized protein YecT (DUF1311 family)
MKISLRSSIFAYGLALAMLFGSPANATNDPDWWVEDSETLPKYSDYKLFAITPDENAAFDSKQDQKCYADAMGDNIKPTQNTIIKELACNRKQFARIDKRLNRSYRTLMAALPANRQQILRQEQRDWLATRDQMCEDIPAYKFKSATLEEVLDLDNCRMGELFRRTTWIERYHGFARIQR